MLGKACSSGYPLILRFSPGGGRPGLTFGPMPMGSFALGDMILKLEKILASRASPIHKGSFPISVRVSNSLLHIICVHW